MYVDHCESDASPDGEKDLEQNDDPNFDLKDHENTSSEVEIYPSISDRTDDVETEPTAPMQAKRKRTNKRLENKKLRLRGRSYPGLGKDDEGKFDHCDRGEKVLGP